MTEKIVPEHIETLNIKTVMVVPSHQNRTESPEFRKAKEILRKDGNLDSCWLCGSKKSLQVHHFWAEWCEGNIINFDILKKLCNLFDIYGYSKQFYDTPITSIDTILQMMTLCEEHHTGTDSTNGGTPTGIHQMPFNEWILQKVAKVDPIPQEGFTIKQTEDAIEEFQEKELSDEDK